ncbi:MAG: TolC family protein [Bryobacteraceae bacterium]|jgi:outer membrane protein TolC
MFLSKITRKTGRGVVPCEATAAERFSSWWRHGTAPLALLTAGAALAQVPPPPQAVPNGPAPVLMEQPQVSFSGSVATGQVSAMPLALSLRDAIQRGLRYNLGILTNRDIADTVKAERRRTLSTLLPSLSVGATQTSQQIDLVAFGLSLPGIPVVVGPFGYQNVRAYFQQTVYDRTSLKNLKSASESQKAAELTAEDARNLVVQAVSNGYLAIITDSARVDAIQAELNTAQALYDRASDQKRAGTVPGIDVLRADVQRQTEQQRLLAQKNQVEKDKLTLARTIGLPAGQQFSVTDLLPFTPLPTALDDLLKQAYDHRADFRAAQANVRAAEFAIEAARAEHYWPSVVVQGDYGDIGPTLANSHTTYSLLAGVRFPIYAGGRSQTDIDQAEAVLSTKKNAMEDLRGRIDYEVRNALLDLQSAADQVAVARTNVDLATETLAEARDRFAAGVTDNIEVVQAQQLLAAANENYIGSLNAHNGAKIALATALGTAEEGVPQYLNLKP